MLCSASVTPSPARAGREGGVCAIGFASLVCATGEADFLGQKGYKNSRLR